jgi:uncharacterized protein (DUF2267 family)
MSMTGLDVFDTTLQKTNLWLKEIMQDLGWDDRHKAYEGLRVTLHALRDRLTVAEMADLGAQLPLLVRGAFYESWVPTSTPRKVRHVEEFLTPVREYFARDTMVDAEKVVRAVFRVLAEHITAGELRDIQHVLPEELKTLWPADALKRA